MIYATPSREFDGITTGLRLMVAATDLIALSKDQPDREAEYLQEAANLIKDAWLAVQTAAGRATESAAKERERQGERQCLLCHQWKLLDQMVRCPAGYGSEAEGKTNHWWACRHCFYGTGGGLFAPQTNHSDDADPFDEEEGA